MRKCITHHHACDCREALFARALKIADESMTSTLTTNAIRADEHGVMWALVDFEGGEVATLYEAYQGVIDAVEWLIERGLCELVEHPDGATVVLSADLEAA